MLLEVLYVPGCPNHQPAVGRLREILRSEGIDFPIHEVAITDEATAWSLRFPGSPTIRINGEDAEPTTDPCRGIACRLYLGDGLPSEKALRHAILAARMREAHI